MTWVKEKRSKKNSRVSPPNQQTAMSTATHHPPIQTVLSPGCKAEPSRDQGRSQAANVSHLGGESPETPRAGPKLQAAGLNQQVHPLCKSSKRPAQRAFDIWA